MASGISSVAMPSLGPTLEGVIEGIDKANKLGTEAVGDAVQIFSSLMPTADAPQHAGMVSDLGSYPDPVQFLSSALSSASEPPGNFVPLRDVLSRLADPEFNFGSAIDDALDGFLSEQGLVAVLKNPKWAEHMQIDQTQSEQLQNMQNYVKEMLDLSRSVSRNMRA